MFILRPTAAQLQAAFEQSTASSLMIDEVRSLVGHMWTISTAHTAIVMILAVWKPSF